MKATLTLSSLVLAASAMAQIVPVVTLRDLDSNVVNGTTLIVYGNPGTTLLELDLHTELNGSVARTINVRRHELNVVAGSKNYFCWGVCYLPRASGNTPTWDSVDPLAMNPQQVLDNFHAYYRPEGTTNYCCFQYVWYAMDNPDDSTWVNICFDTQTFTGVQEQTTRETAVNVYPNPANMGGDLWLDYQLTTTGNAQAVVYNALGARAYVRPLNALSGRAALPTTTLSPGVWFAAVEQNGRMVATRRFVVTR